MLALRRLAPVSLLLLPTLLWTAACTDAGQESGPIAEAEGEQTGPLPPRGHAWVIFGADTILAEVADTPEAREQGLMHRTELSEGRGMLFVFDDMAPRSFWMRNTYIPLDIAFLDRDQRVVDIQQMEPETEEFTESTSPAMFALEVRQGWFEDQEIEAGAEARIVFGRR